MKTKVVALFILLSLLALASCVPLPPTRAEIEARIKTKIPACMNFKEVAGNQIVVDSNYTIYEVQVFTNGDIKIEDTVKRLQN